MVFQDEGHLVCRHFYSPSLIMLQELIMLDPLIALDPLMVDQLTLTIL